MEFPYGDFSDDEYRLAIRLASEAGLKWENWDGYCQQNFLFDARRMLAEEADPAPDWQI